MNSILENFLKRIKSYFLFEETVCLNDEYCKFKKERFVFMPPSSIVYTSSEGFAPALSYNVCNSKDGCRAVEKKTVSDDLNLFEF